MKGVVEAVSFDDSGRHVIAMVTITFARPGGGEFLDTASDGYRIVDQCTQSITLPREGALANANPGDTVELRLLPNEADG